MVCPYFGDNYTFCLGWGNRTSLRLNASWMMTSQLALGGVYLSYLMTHLFLKVCVLGVEVVDRAFALFLTYEFSSILIYLIARARSTSILAVGLAYKEFGKVPQQSPTKRECVATVGCKSRISVDVLVNQVIYCLIPFQGWS